MAPLDTDTAERSRRNALSLEAPGLDEVHVVPWPLLLRKRVVTRVEASERYPWIVLATALFGLFSVGFTITILSNSIPRIAGDLHASESSLTWVITAPLLAFAVFGPAAGKLADLKGQRRVYLWSLGGVCAFAGLTAMAPNAATLIACRAIGAAVGAAEAPASLAIINRTFAPDQRPKALGWWSMIGAGAPVIGVVAGGPVVEAFGWRWIFVAQVPLTLITLALAWAVLPDVRNERPSAFDIPGATLLGVGALALLLAINRGPEQGWTSPLVLGGIVLAVVAFSAFVPVERRSDHPLLPLAYLRRTNFTWPMVVQFFANFAYMGGFIVTPLFLQNEFGYGESHTGFLLIARPLTFAIAGPIAGYLTLRIGERTSALIGGGSILLSMLALAQVAPGTSDLVVVGSLALSGLGMGTSSPAMVSAIANTVDDDDLGVAGATQQMVSLVGVVLGIQVMQSVQLAREGAVGGVGSFHDAYLVGAVAAGLAVVAGLFVRRSRLGAARDEGAPEGALVSDRKLA